MILLASPCALVGALQWWSAPCPVISSRPPGSFSPSDSARLVLWTGWGLALLNATNANAMRSRVADDERVAAEVAALDVSDVGDGDRPVVSKKARLKAEQKERSKRRKSVADAADDEVLREFRLLNRRGKRG